MLPEEVREQVRQQRLSELFVQLARLQQEIEIVYAGIRALSPPEVADAPKEE